MLKIETYSKEDLRNFALFYGRLQTFVANTTLTNKIKRCLWDVIGINLNKKTGKNYMKIIFSHKRETLHDLSTITINLAETESENYNKKQLLENLYKFKKIKVLFKNSRNYSKQEKVILKKYIDQIHPEALVLSVICVGKGIDVGCGYRKTHPNAIGVDWVGKGEWGRAGNVKGMVSEADIQAKGDDLKMFKSNSLDYVVSRHNLEHYHKPEKTLQEWLRVLKKGGFLGIVVPNSANSSTAEKTHFYNFTLENFKEMLLKTQQMRILKIGECIPGWSYYCIAAKIS